MARRARYAATNENLIKLSLEPALRWLIAAALDRSTLTYGEVKARLEREASFSTIFATRIGVVAGALMHKIQEVEPDAPLINVLVVSQKDGRPSKGAGGFMAERFGVPKLAEDGAKERYPALWERNFVRAADEVYSYGAEDWADLFARVFNRPLPQDSIDQERDKRKQGKEKDGVQTGRRYGEGGEGPLHKALRLWVCENPEALSRRFAGALAETEFDLDSGDRVDVVYQCAERTIVIEVKSRISDAIDLRRGVFQCIKYRAVKSAMDVRPDAPVEAWLVTEEPVKGEIAALLKRHKIKHFLAPQDRD